MFKSRGSVSGAVLSILLLSSSAHARPNEIDPFAFLIGEWDVHEEGASAAAITTASWGAGETSIRLQTDLVQGGQREIHFEGMLVWNPIRREFDMLLNLDPEGGRVQERGRVFVAADGTVTRDIVAAYAPGTLAPNGERVAAPGAEFVFRQTYRKVSDDRIQTSMMRQTSAGWVATFPGSEEMVMTRRRP